MKFFKKISSILVAISAAMPASVFTATADADVTYTSPPATKEDFIVAFCVIGASEASGISSYSDLTYTALPVGSFTNGLKLFDDRSYVLAGADDDTICKDGIYLKPSQMRVRETTFKIPIHSCDCELVNHVATSATLTTFLCLDFLLLLSNLTNDSCV